MALRFWRMEYLQMDSNNNQGNDKGRVKAIWQWLTQSNTRMVGVILLIAAFSLFLALMVLLSQKSTKKKVEATIPQASPITSQPSQLNQIPVPTPTPDSTMNWTSLTNSNGFKIKYPAKAKVLPSLTEATSSSHLQIIATDSATLAVEVLDKNNPSIKDKSLLDIVNLIRDKNKDQNILTRPISILYGGNEGYEWYFKGDKFTTLTQVLTVKDTKYRVIEFNKGSKHYLIFSSFDDSGGGLLSTLRLN